MIGEYIILTVALIVYAASAIQYIQSIRPKKIKKAPKLSLVKQTNKKGG